MWVAPIMKKTDAEWRLKIKRYTAHSLERDAVTASLMRLRLLRLNLPSGLLSKLVTKPATWRDYFQEAQANLRWLRRSQEYHLHLRLPEKAQLHQTLPPTLR